MARVTSEKVGRGLCPSRDCGDLVMYRKSAGGMLTHKCDGCDSSGYAPPGSHSYEQRMKSIADHAAATLPTQAKKPLDIPAPAPEPKAAPVPVKTAIKARPAFSFQDL